MRFPFKRLSVPLGLAIVVLAPVMAQSAVLTVTNTQDSGAGSLRDTIAAASAGDTIVFHSALNGQTITLTSGEILINKSLTINGPGPDQLGVQRSTETGTPPFRIFNIPNITSEIALSGLAIVNGIGSSPGYGGGILVSSRTLSIANCGFVNNSATYSGGGIACFGAGFAPSMVSIVASTFVGNSSGAGGAAFTDGIDFYGYQGALLTIDRSNIFNNTAATGGGIYNEGGLTITNSNIMNNSATGDASASGGGISNPGRATIANCTISNNRASLGGAVRSSGSNPLTPGTLTITNSTIFRNSASEGGGLYLGAQSTIKSRSTIIASNSSENGSGPDITGPLTSEGFNLIGNNAGATISPAQASDQIGTPGSPIDPLLGGLQYSGGRLATHPPLPGSPAIDKGDSGGTTHDERGFGRPRDIPGIPNAPGGDGSDIGAVEATLPALANISSRLHVETGDNAMIGGFIITGTEPKTVIVRGIGPSLPLPGALADPFIEVYGPSGEFLATNDNWNDATTRPEIIASGLAPANGLEPALWGVINPGAYSVVVRGKNDATGVGLFEVYDLDQSVDSSLGNISTRGFVGTGNDVLIGGTIITGSSPAKVLFRAIGPSLTNFGINNALGDPVLELHDGNGQLLAINYDWRDDHEAEIMATGLAPSDNRESAIVRDLAPGNYTAIVHGFNNTTGIALVEAYNIQ